MPYDSLSRRLSQLPDPEEQSRDWEFAPYQQTHQLTDQLKSRPLGPSGRRLLSFLQTGEGLTPELEQLLRRVCLKIKFQVFDEKEGMVDSSETLDPDVILEELPKLIHEEQVYQANLRFAFGCKPYPGDDTLLAGLLEPSERQELARRLSTEPPYNTDRADRLPFEPVPGESVEEEILD